jgi:hypothetical protein
MTDENSHIQTKIYQMEMLHRKFADILNTENYGKTHHHSPTPAKSVISLHSSSEIPLSSLN